MTTDAVHLSAELLQIDWSDVVDHGYTSKRARQKLDGCIAWNERNTVFGSKAICTQAVYYLYSTMPSVTCLRLSDVSIICRVTYLQFSIQACFSSMSVSQAAQRRIWFTQYRTSDVAENFGR